MGKVPSRIKFDEDGLPIPQTSQVDNIQFDDEGLPVPVKKKEGSALSMAGAKAVPSGGKVGSSNPQSEKDKVLEYLKVTKPQVSVTTPSAKEAESVTSIIKAKGVKQPITQVKFKKDESPFDQTKEEAFASASDKLNEVMYGDGDGWLDPIKANITKAQNAPNSKEAMANIGANNLVEMSLAPSGYYADKVLKNSIWSQASGDNLTANMLRQKADDYQKRTAAFQGIQKSESDTGSGNANKEFYNYVYGQQIDNAAIKSYAEKNPNFKEQLQAAGIDLNDPQLSDRIGSAKAGQIISESIFDPEVIEYAKNEAPWLLPALKSKASTLITDYKDFGVNLVANKVSRAIQESGYNNIDPIFNFANDNIKEFARSTAKLELTPEEYAVYEKNILGNEEKYLDTPSFFEGFASAGKSMLSGAKSTLTTPFKSIPETIREGWEKEATNVSADPKGLMKVIRDSGHAVGIVSSLAAIGNVLGGGGTGFYSTKVVPALSGAIPFMGDFVEEGTMKYPNNPVKAWTSALFNTAMYSALSYKIFPVKDVQNAFKNIKPEVAEIVENLASGRITREVARQQMSTVAKKGFDLLTGSVAKSAKISAELTGITALNSMLDKVMGMSGDTFEKYHPEGEEADAFTSLFLSNLVVGGIAKFGEMKRGNRIVEQSLYAAASNPKRFQDIIDKMEVKDPTINKQEMLDNLTYLTQVKDGLDKTGVDPKNQARYLFEAMKEKVQADAIKSTPDANITRMGESKINESRKIKDRILEGEDVVGEEQAEVEKESGKGKLTAEQILDKAVNDGEIKGIYADMVKAGQGDLVLKDIAQQAQNLGADGEPLNDGNEAISKKSMISQFGKEVVDAAIERYKYTNGESEQISQPIELSPELPEGYELPKQPVVDFEVNIPQTKTEENAIQIGSTEKTNVGETPGDSAKVGEGVSQPKEPAGTRTQEESKIEGEEGLAEPPKTPPPTEKVVIPESSKNSERDKGILNRLYKAKNTPKEAKEGFEKEGLKYEPKSQEEAFGIAKSIIDEYGIDEAVSIAQSMKFDGDVNSLIIGESLNRLYDKIEEAKTNSEKLELAKQYEDLSILYDKLGRYGGRFNSAVHFFYKKSPLGIILLENTKRREDFAKWAKQKEKSWREVYEEIKDIPEFAEVFNEKVSEKVKSERVEARKAKREKVHKAIDDTMAKWAKKFSADLPEGTKKAGVSIDVFKAAATTMKKAYDAGEAIGKVIQDAIDYITKETGINDWDKEGFRAEWAEKLTEGKGKKVFTDEESKSKYIEKLKKKLTGLSEKQKEDVIRKAFAKAIEKDALKYDDLREIIQNVVGRGELTSEEQAKLTELVKKTNAVEEAAKKVREERTEESLRRFRLAEIEAGKATRELNEILWNKPDILKRLTSIMQLNTLGIPALVNNPIYNIWNQATLRFPVGIINDLIDRGMALAAKVAGKQYERDYNVWETQKEFFKKLGFGSKESLQQLMTGLNRMDYIQKEVYGQQIRPGRAIRDLFAYATGKKSLSKSQIIDKSLQATVGIPAEAVARVLNIGDKPQRFAAEGSQAAAFAKELGLKDMDYRLFIEFPREEAYRIYKEQGLSDAEAGKKADYVRDVILKEGQRSTFQQDNILNNVINAAFGQLGGKDSGTAALAKSLTVSPFIKIPSNAFWAYYNLVNPEVAILQSMIHAGRAVKLRGKGDNSSKLAMRESRYWLAHAITGMAMRAVVVSLVQAGIYNPSNDEDNTKKEREGEANYEPQGTVNITKLAAMLRGDDPNKVEGGLAVQDRWFGQWGTVGNAIARKYQDATPEQREKQDEFWNIVLGGLEIEGLKEMGNGVFSNTSALLSAFDTKGSFGWSQYGLNTIGMFTNIIHPATFSQMSRAEMNEATTNRANTFMGQVKNSMLARSSVLRKLTGQYPETKVGIWGDKIEKQGNVAQRLFGITPINKDAFARPIYNDAERTGDIGYFPPAVQPKIGDTKLTQEQYNKFQEYVGNARKSYIAPFINDQAKLVGFNVLYSQLNDDDKKYVLQYLYQLGSDDGKAKLYQDYPELKPKKENTDFKKEVERDLFKILQKYQKK